jgi:hypothetical protein
VKQNRMKLMLSIGLLLLLAGSALIAAAQGGEELLVQPVEIPAPEGDEPVELILTMPFASLAVEPLALADDNPEAADVWLVEGDLQYSDAELEAAITVDEDVYRIEQDVTGDDLRALAEARFPNFWEESAVENNWNLRLGSAPLMLRVDSGAADVNLALGGLTLTGLDFELGAGDVNIDFAEPNAASMAVMRVRTGAGSLNLTGLANANADEIALDSGAGDFQLAFDGDLQQDMVVEVDAGAGRVVITVPAGVNAEVRANEGLVVRVTAQGDWTRERSGVYTLSGEADGYKLSFDVEAGVGEIVLRTA